MKLLWTLYACMWIPVSIMFSSCFLFKWQCETWDVAATSDSAQDILARRSEDSIESARGLLKARPSQAMATSANPEAAAKTGPTRGQQKRKCSCSSTTRKECHMDDRQSYLTISIGNQKVYSQALLNLWMVVFLVISFLILCCGLTRMVKQRQTPAKDVKRRISDSSEMFFCIIQYPWDNSH